MTLPRLNRTSNSFLFAASFASHVTLRHNFLKSENFHTQEPSQERRWILLNLKPFSKSEKNGIPLRNCLMSPFDDFDNLASRG